MMLFPFIQANIIIKGLINKLAVENLLSKMVKMQWLRVGKVKAKLPHFRHHGVDVYIPFLLAKSQ